MSLAHRSWRHHTGPLYKVWQEWWGNSENEAKLEAGKVVDLKSSTVNFAEPTQGQFVIREYHTSLLASLQQVNTHRHGGVVISGQPGSGKSYSLLYLLLKTLIKREPILFLPVNTGAHYFSSDGVQYNPLVDETCLDELNDDEGCTWALVNSDSNHQPPPIPLFAAFGIFIIQSSLPCRSQYRLWVKQKAGLIWYVQRWTKREIIQALALIPALSQMLLDELEASVDKVIVKWGWAPRDVATALTEENQLENALTAALRQLKTTIQLVELLGQITIIDTRDESSQSIVSLYQSRAGKPIVDFKSPYIRYRAVQWRLGIVVIPRKYALQLIAHCQPPGDNASLAGWAFEHFVYDILCAPPNRGELSSPCAALASGTTWSLQIEPFHVAQTSTSLASHHSGLVCVTFNKTLDNVTLDDTKLFIPPQPNFPLLDGFFLQLDNQARHVTVVILQVTISLKHIGSVQGYIFLARLKTHLERLDIEQDDPANKRSRREWAVSFTYCLVVPSPSTSQTFTWSIPGEAPESIAGPVYFQVAQPGNCILSDEEDESSFVEDI